MGLEAFIIFISTLISLNTSHQGQSPEDAAKQCKKEIKQRAPENTLARGGWDRN